MLLQRLSRSANSAWRPILSECPTTIPRVSLPSSIRQRRHLHQKPTLPYETEFVNNGVPTANIGLFLSPRAFATAWTDYQSLMVQRLNEITVGFDAYNASSKQLVLQYARSPETANLFNHASMAHNNHFFFGTMSPSPTSIERYSVIHDSLIRAYGSLDTLKQTMLGTANAMFGPGFVWLVAVDASGGRGKTWKILTTYNAGTPYAEAGYRQQDKDMNVQNTVGHFGASSAAGRRAAMLPPGAASVEPVLCVSTWEHVYLHDYGLDKWAYLEAWWDAINWGEVSARAPSTGLWDHLGDQMPRGQFAR